MRVFLKPQGKEADLADPLIVKAASAVGMVCDAIHRDWRKRFRYANVWPPCAQFPGQQVGLDHVLQDSDILTNVLRTGSGGSTLGFRDVRSRPARERAPCRTP